MRRARSAMREWREIRKRVRGEFAFHAELSHKEFGAARFRREALRELGGDWRGLLDLFRAYQVTASPWFYPILLLACSGLLSGMPTNQIVMGPARLIWVVVAVFCLFKLPRRMSGWLWFAYFGLTFLLHAVASLLLWAAAMQFWRHVPWSTDGAALAGFLVVLFTYAGTVFVQCRYGWRDLQRRCPACLETLRLPLIDGSADCVLLRPASVERICVHGHGALFEDRWTRCWSA